MARVYSSKTKGLRIATRCGSQEQFIAAFQRTVDARSFFIPALAQRPVGLETAFSVDLQNGTPMLRGLGIVLASWPTTDNPFNRPGVQIGVRRLTPESEKVFEQLLIARALAAEANGTQAPELVPPETTDPSPRPAALGREPLATIRMEPLQIEDMAREALEAQQAQQAQRAQQRAATEQEPQQEPPASDDVAVIHAHAPAAQAIELAVPVEAPIPAPAPPAPIAAPAPIVPVAPVAPAHAPAPAALARRESRTPGSSIVLPANPLADLSDEKLEGFIDCTLYEDDASALLDAPTRSWWWPLSALRGTLRKLRKNRNAA